MSLSIESPFGRGINLVILAGVIEQMTNMPDNRVRLHLLIPNEGQGIKVKAVVHQRILHDLESQGVDLTHAFVSIRGHLKMVERKREMSLQIVASSVVVLDEPNATSTQCDHTAGGSLAAGRPRRARRNGESASRRPSADSLA